jgi:hypothetical protein
VGLISYITAASAVCLFHISSCIPQIPQAALQAGPLPPLISTAASQELDSVLLEEVAEASSPRRCVWKNLPQKWSNVAYETSCIENFQAVRRQFHPYQPHYCTRLDTIRSISSWVLGHGRSHGCAQYPPSKPSNQYRRLYAARGFSPLTAQVMTSVCAAVAARVLSSVRVLPCISRASSRSFVSRGHSVFPFRSRLSSRSPRHRCSSWAK